MAAWVILLLSWGGNPADTLPCGRTRCLPHCKQTTALTTHPKIWCWGMQCCWSIPLLWAHSLQCFPPPNLSLAFPAKTRAVAQDAEHCCFPWERSLLPLQKSLEASKSILGHFHTRGCCTHSGRQSLPDESGTSLATVKVWGETHISQLVLAPMRARARQGKADWCGCWPSVHSEAVFSCASPCSCFERKPKSWRIWEIPLAMPLFCISPCAGQPRRLFSFLTTQRVKDLEHGPPNPAYTKKKHLFGGFFITLSFILDEILLNKSLRFVPAPVSHNLLIWRWSSGTHEANRGSTWGGQKQVTWCSCCSLPENTTFSRSFPKNRRSLRNTPGEGIISRR